MCRSTGDSPQFDATFYPRYMSKRGFQLGTEARYVDEYTTHVTRGEYLPDDDEAKRSRYALRIQHYQNLGRGFSAAVDWSEVSDKYYWKISRRASCKPRRYSCHSNWR